MNGEASAWCAAEWLARAPQSLGELKSLVSAQSAAALETHLEGEKAAFLRCAATPNFAARVATFAEKAQKRLG